MPIIQATGLTKTYRVFQKQPGLWVPCAACSAAPTRRSAPSRMSPSPSSRAFAERFAQFRRRLAGFQGRVLPYLGGVLDIAFVVVVLDSFGIGLAQVRALLGV